MKQLPLFLLAFASLAGAASAQSAAFADLATGKAVYEAICQGCHMPDAKGAAGAGRYPALAGNARLGAAAYPLMVVARGQKAMPEFGSSLSDAQIAGVVGYIRTNFGNRFDAPVTPAEAAKLRPVR